MSQPVAIIPEPNYIYRGIFSAIKSHTNTLEAFDFFDRDRSRAIKPLYVISSLIQKHAVRRRKGRLGSAGVFVVPGV